MILGKVHKRRVEKEGKKVRTGRKQKKEKRKKIKNIGDQQKCSVKLIYFVILTKKTNKNVVHKQCKY